MKQRIVDDLCFLVSSVKKMMWPSVLIMMLMSVLGAMMLSACESGASLSYEPVRPAKEVLVCDDRTIPDSIYDSGVRLAVRNLDRVVARTGQGSITVTFAKIDEHSFRAESTLVEAQIPAVKPQPNKPRLSPFIEQGMKKQIEDQYLAKMREAQESLQQARRQAKHVEEAIMQHDANHVPHAARGTDIMGCLLKANDLFSAASGVERYLVVVSDLVENLDASKNVSLHLSGVTVTLIFYCMDPAHVCQDRKSAYQSLLARAGARVRYEDVSQIDLIKDAFGQ